MTVTRIRNNTPYILNIGIWLAGSLNQHVNNLHPGMMYTCDLRSFPHIYTFEIRRHEGTNHFSPADGEASLAERNNMFAAGTISVLTGLAWGSGILGLGGRVGRVVSVLSTKSAFTTIGERMQEAVRRRSFCLYLGGG